MRKLKKMTWDYEPEGDDNPFLEREEEGAEKVDLIAFELEYDITPGDPGCWRTPNGDGWPPSGPEVEYYPKCIRLEFVNGEKRIPTPEEAKQAEDWLNRQGDTSIGENITDRIFDCEG